MANAIQCVFAGIIVWCMFSDIDSTIVNLNKTSQEILDAHNKYRFMHGVPSLKLNPEISKLSQEWADHLLESGTFQHRPKNKYGENLYMIWYTGPRTRAIDSSQAVKSWYDEIRDYTFGDGFSLKTGHFTQLVWKNSKELGVGVAEKVGRIIVVCNYFPPGNYKSQYSQNVIPIKT